MKKFLALFLASALLLCGCAAKSATTKTDNINVESAPAASTTPADFAVSAEELFTNRDRESGYDKSQSVIITLTGASASCSSSAVSIEGGSITITAAGTYILSGTLRDGTVTVDAGDKDKVRLVLDGVQITGKNAAALLIKKADKVFVTLAEGSSNSLSNGGSFSSADSNIDGAVFSKEDLTFNGTGSLSVSSPAGHGIVCKDDLVFTGGTFTIEAGGHGLEANDSVRIEVAVLRIQAGKDGIHAENDDDETKGFVFIAGGRLEIESDGDGISAGSTMQIEDGRFTLLTGGGSENAEPHSEGFMGGPGGWGQRGPFSTATDDNSDTVSCKGLKADGSLLINGGDFTLNTADDAVHSNASILINGGIFSISTGDDGFHADETLTVTGGTIDITESYEGLEALHLEIGGGDIRIVATDDGLNAAGGTDESGFGGPRGNDRFGGPGMGGRPGMGGTPDMGGDPGTGGAPGRKEEPGGSASEGSILISGGTIYIQASGDGIDANGSLTISGGHITVCGPSRGDTATLDYDTTGVIIGGVFIGTGGASMAQSFSSSEQGVIAVNTGNQSAGTKVTLTDKSGNVLLSHTPDLDYTVVILSSPDLVSGEEYTLTVGGQSGSFAAK